MAKTESNQVLREKQQVVSLMDQRGVPRGTPGRVRMVSGVTWIRYFVDFDNGTSVATMDRKKLATPEEWKLKKDQPVGVPADAVPSPADSAPAASAGEAVGGIPAHLLERSKKARERLAAKAG